MKRLFDDALPRRAADRAPHRGDEQDGCVPVAVAAAAGLTALVIIALLCL